MSKKRDDAASRPNKENPEWTRDDFLRGRPALDVITDIFGADTAETLKRARGRPPKEDFKVNQTLRLDAEVLEAYRKAGKGWQTLINEVLRQHMPSNEG
jgi:uncharacterized protein (DUF4415 family)